MNKKREWITVSTITAVGIALVGGPILLIAWAAKHDVDELNKQHEAIRIMARYEWLRAVEEWSERGEQGQHPMDFVPQALRENETAREAIANAKFDAVKKEAGR